MYSAMSGPADAFRPSYSGITEMILFDGEDISAVVDVFDAHFRGSNLLE